MHLELQDGVCNSAIVSSNLLLLTNRTRSGYISSFCIGASYIYLDVKSMATNLRTVGLINSIGAIFFTRMLEYNAPSHF